ncbi:MAG TPA: hypothetical protein VHO01_12655, partial [Jatrophihabitans sp.]|nr:hypothetical protein [Jatrophihabitans sp.]
MTATSTESVAAALERPATGSPAERFTARDPEAFGVPTGREEDWRFTPIRKLREFFQPFDADGEVEGTESVPAGARVQRVDPQQLDAFGSALTPADGVSALAMAHARHGLHVTV